MWKQVQEGIKNVLLHEESYRNSLLKRLLSLVVVVGIGTWQGTAATPLIAFPRSPMQRQIKPKLAKESRYLLSQPASHSPVLKVGTAAGHHSPFSPDLFRPSEQQWLNACSSVTYPLWC